MKWNKKLYTKELTDSQTEEIRQSIENGEYPKKIHLITLAAKAEDLLDIREVSYLKYACIRKACPLIVGLAADRHDALSIVTDIVDECYRMSGSTDVKAYLGD